MSVYTYTVQSRGGSAPLDFSIEAKSTKQAEEKLMQHYDPKTHRATLKEVFEGTMDEWLGSETVDRIEKAKNTYRMMAEEKQRARNRLQTGD